jgi:hypothetical protein
MTDYKLGDVIVFWLCVVLPMVGLGLIVVGGLIYDMALLLTGVIMLATPFIAIAVYGGIQSIKESVTSYKGVIEET